jgi:hypothetical protein
MRATHCRHPGQGAQRRRSGTYWKNMKPTGRCVKRHFHEMTAAIARAFFQWVPHLRYAACGMTITPCDYFVPKPDKIPSTERCHSNLKHFRVSA